MILLLGGMLVMMLQVWCIIRIGGVQYCGVIYTNCLYDLLFPVVIPGDNVLVEVLSLLYKVEPVYYTDYSGEDMAEVE
jgi:hypothetical protein